MLETCDDVAAAREALARIPVHAPQNLTLLDRTGAYVTAYVGPGPRAAVRRLAATTNHQGEVEWPEYARGDPQRGARACVLELLRPGADRERFEDAFLEPPLHSTAHERGFGTLYTAAYEPGRGRVRYRWPDLTWEQSFERFEPGSPDRHAVLNASAPVGAGLLRRRRCRRSAPWTPAIHSCARSVSSLSSVCMRERATSTPRSAPG